jgi:SOS-response transcriptional repressor LexA
VREAKVVYFKTTFRIYNVERAAAGLGNYLSDSPYEDVELDAKDIPPKADYGVRIDGDSMEPEIPDRSVVFVRSWPDVESGRIGIFALNGSAYCKRVEINRETATLRLLSNNPAYEPIEVKPDDSFHTFGQVLGHVARKETVA